MAAPPSVSGVVRELLTADLSLSADDVIKAVQRRGVTAPASIIRGVVHNVRSELKKKAARTVPGAPRQTTSPAPQPAASPAPAAAAAPTAAAPAGLTAVLANVALVNRVIGVAGGTENARQVAEAVRACGGVDEFLQHLETVAGIRAAE